jgi:nucleoside-diphosphate-sugar epimerase
MILITGGTGFLGQRLAQRLVDDGAAVALMGRDFSAVAPSLRAQVRLCPADLRDRRAVMDACTGVDAVYHAGALSAPWGRRRDFWDINVGGTSAVIEGCREHHVRRLIYVSSPSVVFDGGDQHNLGDDAPYPRRFASFYSETKKLGEDQVNAARASLQTVIVRPKAIFGPGDRALLPRLIAAARAGRLPQIGDGRNRVDLTYVENVAHALQCALHAPTAVGGTYTITNQEHPLLWEVIRSVLQQQGLTTDLRRIPLPLAHMLAASMELRASITGTEPLLTRYTVAILARTQTYDSTHAAQDLNYTPLVSVEEGIRRTLEALWANDEC